VTRKYAIAGILVMDKKEVKHFYGMPYTKFARRQRYVRLDSSA